MDYERSTHSRVPASAEYVAEERKRSSLVCSKLYHRFLAGLEVCAYCKVGQGKAVLDVDALDFQLYFIAFVYGYG